jgi:mono/diheme cytochrome c family protein
MSERVLAGAVGLYDTADEAVEGIRRVREQGFRRVDVVSPYPIHGIDEILGAKPSKLGYVALVAGLTGVTIGKIAQWWMSEVDYPLNIGGKPLFSLPAFVPVVFEMMVLSASLAVVIALLTYFVRLPKYGGALLDSKFISALTCDRFGVVIDAGDPAFDGAAIEGLLRTHGASDVDLLYREVDTAFYRERVGSFSFIALLAAVAFFSVSATHLVMKYAGEAPPFNFMVWQVKLNPQKTSDLFPDGLGMRMPVPHTVARGYVPYAYATDAEAAGREMINPVPVTKELLELGRKHYTTFCQPCHGPRAAARMTLTKRYPAPPSLHSKKVRDDCDGRIYHVITVGQNAMPSYASQISRADRWAIINYVRVLQRSQNAPDRDLQ